MRYVGWFLSLVAVGLLFWLAFVFGISFLQLNGLLLNDIIQIEATFKDFSWVEYVAAFGTFAAAIAAAVSAHAANKSSKLSAATLQEMERQRLSAELVADKNVELEREKRCNIANADKAMIAFAVIGISEFLRELAKVYQQLWLNEGRLESGLVSLTPEGLSKISANIADLPMQSIEILHKAVNTNPDKIEVVTSVLHWTQVHYSRVTGLFKDMQSVHVLGTNVLDPMIKFAETQVELTALLVWARANVSSERLEVPDSKANALSNMRLDIKFQNAIEARMSRQIE